MEEPKLRHELKHYINVSDYMALRQRLGAITRQDPHVDETGRYRIRSLYFDNFDDKALRDKIDGVNNREKFRIRYYNEDTNCIKLEKKSKLYGLCSKISAKLTKEQCKSIIDGNIQWMRNNTDPLINELYAKMNLQQFKPKTVVDYIREPYIYEPGNVRITIDSEIKTGLNSKELFDQNTVTIRTHNRNIIILEVKYDEFLPEIIRDIVQVNNRQNSAFSKYAVCRVYG